MKNFLLCLIITFLVFSCSTDEEAKYQNVSKAESELINESSNVHNSANPYEQSGVNFYKQLNWYVTNNGYSSSARQITDQMLFLSNSFTPTGKLNKSVITITPEMVALILADPQNKLLELINDSSLNLEVKINLTDFVSDLVQRQDDNYDEVYSFIISYETAVIADSILHDDEKDTILKVSSISRYSLYAEARQRDRDWETAVTNKNANPIFTNSEVTLITLAVLFNTLQ